MKRRSGEPLVSIITPSFNQREFLEDNLLSVKGQEYPELEHIVVDGGSTDGSVEVLKKYDSSIRWISEPDNGQSDAINKGFTEAKGEIIGWLNSDDLYLPGAVEKAVNELTNNPGIGAVYGYAKKINDIGEETGELLSPAYDRQKLFRSPDFIWQPTVFMRRAVLEKAGYLDESLNYIMDFDLWLRIGMIADFKLIPDFLAAYRYHEGAKSVALEEKFWPELRSLYKKYDHMKISPIYVFLRNIRPLYAVWLKIRTPRLLKLRDKLFGFK